MSARLAALAVVCVAVTAAADAPIVVRGTVADKLTGAPIAGAVVLGAHTSALTGPDGTFAIGVDATERELSVTAPGHALQSVQLGGGPIVIALDRAANEAIEVHGTRPAPPGPQARTLSADEIHALPGSANDALRAAQALPGVARIPYSFGAIVLRGSDPRDNAIYIDGIEVPLAFHFGGLTSVYPTNLLSSMTVTGGGFDAMYGRAEGGIVELATRDPRTDAVRIGGSVGLLDSAAQVELPLAGGGVLAAVRRSYFDFVARPFVSEDFPLPNYLDAQLRGVWGDPAGTGRISPVVFMSLDRVAVTDTSSGAMPDTTNLSSFFIRAGVPYLRTWGPLALHAVAWLGADTFDFTSVTDGHEETFQRPTYPGGARADLSQVFPWGEVRGGVDFEGGYLSHTEEGLGQPGDILLQDNGATTRWWIDSALWGDARVDIAGDRLSVKPGLRVDRYGLTGEVVVDPRLAIRERLTDWLALRETLGRYHQAPTPGDLDPNGGNPQLKSSYFDQSALGVDAAWRDWTLSLTGYYNVGHDLGVQIGNAGPEFSDLGALGPVFELLLEKQLGLAFYRQNIGRALDRGLEVSLKRQTERWLWMASYTLSYADRTDDPMVLIGWRPFELDQRHNLNLIASRRWRQWTFGGRIQLVSGMPYTPGATPGAPPAPELSARLPWFFQLDLRVDRRFHRRWGDINVYADIQNATDHHNIEGRELEYEYVGGVPIGYEKDLSGLPIAPFIGVEFVPK